MKKTITIKEALTFLNLCASVNSRNTTDLMNDVKVACAVKLLFNEDGDKLDSIQINRNKTGAVIGFSETEKPKEKANIESPKVEIKNKPLVTKKEKDS